jgi:hypothetical protein
MRDADRKTKQPIGDPPVRKQPVRTDESARSKRPDAPMMDPFTEQTTHPAGDGQGANSAGETGKGPINSKGDGEDEETMPVEEGFSTVP